jgi:hypothetical protein
LSAKELLAYFANPDSVSMHVQDKIVKAASFAAPEKKKMLQLLVDNELHKCILVAIHSIGVKETNPTLLLFNMRKYQIHTNAEAGLLKGLNIEHIKSYLQKHRRRDQCDTEMIFDALSISPVVTVSCQQQQSDLTSVEVVKEVEEGTSFGSRFNDVEVQGKISLGSKHRPEVASASSDIAEGLNEVASASSDIAEGLDEEIECICDIAEGLNEEIVGMTVGGEGEFIATADVLQSQIQEAQPQVAAKRQRVLDHRLHKAVAPAAVIAAAAVAAAAAPAAPAATAAATTATAATAAAMNEDESKTNNMHVEPIIKLDQGAETDAGLLGDIEFLNGWMDLDPGPVGDEVGDGSPAIASPQGGSRKVVQKWTTAEDTLLQELVQSRSNQQTGLDWKEIANSLPDRSNAQCYQRWHRNLKPGLLKGRWTSLEDELLIQTINRMRSGSTICVEPGLKGAGVPNAVGFQANDYWPAIAECLTGRSTKQCRERWTHMLDPSLKKTKWTIKEDAALRQAHAEIGGRWTAIAKLIPGRTYLHVRDRWRALSKSDMQNTAVLDV